MSSLVWAANLMGWPLIHISIGSLAVRLPRSLFERDSWVTAPRTWERGGYVYREALAIQKWKSKLPDGAPWLGGAAKNGMLGRAEFALVEFLVETRRAEIAHWAMLCCAPIFFLWNPVWAGFIMLAYAIAANVPCILAQRYNRIHADRVLQTRKRVLARI